MIKFYALTACLFLSINVWSSSYNQQAGENNSTVNIGAGNIAPISNSPVLGTIDLPDGSLCPVCGIGYIYGGVCNNPDCPSNAESDPVGGTVPLDNGYLLLFPLFIYAIIKLKKKNILHV